MYESDSCFMPLLDNSLQTCLRLRLEWVHGSQNSVMRRFPWNIQWLWSRIATGNACHCFADFMWYLEWINLAHSLHAHRSAHSIHWSNYFCTCLWSLYFPAEVFGIGRLIQETGSFEVTLAGGIYVFFSWRWMGLSFSCFAWPMASVFLGRICEAGVKFFADGQWRRRLISCDVDEHKHFCVRW